MPWFVVQHNHAYLGLAGLREIIERTASIQGRDLIRAEEIQQNLLDKSRVNDRRLQVLLYNKMANAIGGDFYQAVQNLRGR